MSAWIVGQAHIRAMVSLAVDGPEGWPAGPIPDADPHALGNLLIAECVASVACRYPDTGPDDLPGHGTYWVRPYVHVPPTRRPTVGEAVGLLDCYAYQSCEHPGWEASQAKVIVDRLLELFRAELVTVPTVPDVWEWTHD